MAVNTTSKSGGFTLIEVMIVVVLVSILLGVALPSYQDSLRKGQRSDAKAALLDVANRQQQLMLDRSRYTDDMTELGFAADPMISPEEHYTVDAIACTSGTLATCYELTATPRTSSPQNNDKKCTKFILDSYGSQSAEGTATDECW